MLPALAAQDDGGEGEEQRRGHQQQQPEHGEDGEHLQPVQYSTVQCSTVHCRTVQYLEPVQHHGHAGVAQLAATRARVVVAQQEVALQRSGDIV